MADVFQQRDICRIFHNKYVIIMGSSVERSMYKDFVKLLKGNVFLSDLELRTKGERCFQGDRLLEGGILQGLSNGTQYREVREYRTDYVLVRFYFITRCYNDYVESIIGDFDKGPSPDLVLMSSVLWDITRYGDNSVPQFKSDIETVFSRLSSSLPSRCLFLWLTCLPVSQFAKGGVFIPEVEYLRNLARLETHLADYHCTQLASSFGFNVLDLCYFLRDHLHRRAIDGIHWDMSAHRRITNLILTHVSQAWGLPLPGVSEDETTQEIKAKSGLLKDSKKMSADTNKKHRIEKMDLRGEKPKLRKIKRRNPKVSQKRGDNACENLVDFKRHDNFNQSESDSGKENAQPPYKTSPQPAYKTSLQPAYKTSPQPAYKTSSQPAYKTSQQPSYKTSPQPAYKTSPQPSYKTSPQPSFLGTNCNWTLTKEALFEGIENLRRGVEDSVDQERKNTGDVDLRNSLPGERLSNFTNQDSAARERQDLASLDDYFDQKLTDCNYDRLSLRLPRQSLDDFDSNDLRNSFKRGRLPNSDVFEQELSWTKHDRSIDGIGNDSWEQDPYLVEKHCSDTDRRNFSRSDTGYVPNDEELGIPYSCAELGGIKSDRKMSGRDFDIVENFHHFGNENNFDFIFDFNAQKRFGEPYERRDRKNNFTEVPRGKGSDNHENHDGKFKHNQESMTKMDLRHNLKDFAPDNPRDEFQSRLNVFTERSERYSIRPDVNASTDNLDRDDLRNRMKLPHTSRTNVYDNRHVNGSLGPDDGHLVSRCPNQDEGDLRNRTAEHNRRWDSWSRPDIYQDEHPLSDENRYEKRQPRLTKSTTEHLFGPERLSSLNLPTGENNRYHVPVLQQNTFSGISCKEDRGIHTAAKNSTLGLYVSPEKIFHHDRPCQKDLIRSPTAYSGGIFETNRLGRQLSDLPMPHLDSPSLLPPRSYLRTDSPNRGSPFNSMRLGRQLPQSSPPRLDSPNTGSLFNSKRLGLQHPSQSQLCMESQGSGTYFDTKRLDRHFPHRSDAPKRGKSFDTKRLGRKLAQRSPPNIDSPRSFGSVVDDVMEAIHNRNSLQPGRDQEWQRQNFNISVPKRIVFVVENERDSNSQPMSTGRQPRSLSSTMRSRLKSIEIETSYPTEMPLREEQVSEFYLDLGRDRSDDGAVWMDSYRR